jgi:arylsulfatase
VQPLEGMGLLPALRSELATLPMDRMLYWERMGNEAVRQGHWKFVRGYSPASANGGIATTGPRTGKWELYDTSTDPGESHDLAAQQSEKITSLVSQYEAWAKRVGVVPRGQIVKHMQSNEKK